jgi:CDR ABC transporter
MLEMSLNFRMMFTPLPEFSSSHITCSVDLGPNQICTLFGARPGTSVVSGKDYIKAGYDLNTDDLWRRNVLVLLVFLLFFWFTQTVVIEVYPVSFAGFLFKLSLTVRLSSNLSVAVVLASLQRTHPRQEDSTRS